MRFLQGTLLIPHQGPSAAVLPHQSGGYFPRKTFHRWRRYPEVDNGVCGKPDTLQYAGAPVCDGHDGPHARVATARYLLAPRRCVHQDRGWPARECDLRNRSPDYRRATSTADSVSSWRPDWQPQHKLCSRARDTDSQSSTSPSALLL